MSSLTNVFFCTMSNIYISDKSKLENTFPVFINIVFKLLIQGEKCCPKQLEPDCSLNLLIAFIPLGGNNCNQVFATTGNDFLTSL